MPEQLTVTEEKEKRLVAAFRKLPEGERTAMLNLMVKAAAGETTMRITEDTRLGRLQARYERRLRELTIPNDGKLKSMNEAKRAERLASTLRDLQKVQHDLKLPVTETPECVKKAAAMASAYRRSHDEHGVPIPARPRGRPRRVEPNSKASVTV